MRVFVTGGTGFVGPAIVRALLAARHEVTALVHRSRGTLPEHPQLRTVQGDVTDAASFAPHLAGHDAVIHLVALRRGRPEEFERLHVQATRHVLAAAKAAGARRFLHMSAHGVERRGTPYQRTKLQAEELVQGSGLAWTIFRPTFVSGPAEGEAEGFDQEFARIARAAPVLPNFAGGAFLLQPVAKRDVALAFVRALDEPKADHQVYVLAGAEAITWRQYLGRLNEALGLKRPLAPVPALAILPLASLLGRFSWFPASHDELQMLFEGHAGDNTPAARDLALSWLPHREMLREALAPAPAAAPAGAPV